MTMVLAPLVSKADELIAELIIWRFQQVSARELGIDASLGIPVVDVTSSDRDGVYGVGSQILIRVR